MNFYFYDLETTGLDPFRDRMMQFAGLRTDASLKPLGEVEEFYVKLSEDVLPSPQAIAAHGILPQTANLEGLSEYQFLNWLEKEAYQPETIYSGYNNADFDDQFVRWLHWRNFADPSPMTHAGSSFDIYRLIRLAADLRPEGLKWPEGINGRRPSLTLTALTAANGISHEGAHRAGADVEATLELARRLKKAQPKLFEHALQLLQAGFVEKIIGANIFLYSSHSNLASGASTTLAAVLAEHPTRSGCFIVYDLRCPPTEWQKLSAYDLSLRLQNARRKDQPRPPFSIIDISRAPAVAPTSVLNPISVEHLHLDKQLISKHWRALKQSGLAKTAAEAYLKIAESTSVPAGLEAILARAKVSDNDARMRHLVRSAKPEEIANLELEFEDPSFKQLRLLYQARNFPKTLKTEQLLNWEEYKRRLFISGKPNALTLFERQIRQTAVRFSDDAEVSNLLMELQVYVENIMPEPVTQ